MRIGQTLGVSIAAGRGADAAVARRVEPAEAAAENRPRDARAPSRALVPVEPPPVETTEARLVRLRVHAPFLAQLLAHRDDLPETRRLRRADPARAAANYARAAEAPGLLVPGYFVDVAR